MPNLMKAWWGRIATSGYPRLWQKLRGLKQQVRKSKNECNKWFVKASNLENGIAELDRLEATDVRSDELHKNRVLLKHKFDDILICVEQDWKQRSKVDWVHHGDRNTKKFQASVKARVHSNNLTTLMIGETLMEEQKCIESHIVNHFKQQFTEIVTCRPTLQGIPFNQVFSSMNEWLTRPFEEPKVETVLTSMADDNAPWIDGFPIGVIKKSWHLMKTDFMNILQDLHATNNLD